MVGTTTRNSDAMPAAHARISSQSRRSRYSGGHVSTMARWAGPRGFRGQTPAEDDVPARPEPLDLLDDSRRLHPGRVNLAARLPDRTRAEHPQRPPRELLGVLAQEVLGVAAPALDVHGAAEHDRVVGLDAGDLCSRRTVDAQARLPQRVGDRLCDLGGGATL